MTDQDKGLVELARERKALLRDLDQIGGEFNAIGEQLPHLAQAISNRVLQVVPGEKIMGYHVRLNAIPVESGALSVKEGMGISDIIYNGDLSLCDRVLEFQEKSKRLEAVETQLKSAGML